MPTTPTSTSLSPISAVYGRDRAFLGVTVLCGVEITHVPPPLISQARGPGQGGRAQLVVVHGETIVEPVEVGTNLAAIEARPATSWPIRD